MRGPGAGAGRGCEAHVGGDLDEEGGELPVVPVGERLVELVGREGADVLEDVVRLGDELRETRWRRRGDKQRCERSPGEGACPM